MMFTAPRYLARVLAGFTLFAATQLSATTITLGANELLGTIIPATPANANNATEQVRYLVNSYNLGTPSGTNLGNNPADPQSETYTLYRPVAAPVLLAAPVSEGKVDTSNPVVDLGGTAYQYVLYYQASSAWVYYIGNISGSNSINWGGHPFPNSNPNWSGGQISHYVLFNHSTDIQVPDRGTTLLLIVLGMGVLCLCALRMKRA